MLHNQGFLAVSHWIMVLQLSVLRVFQAILSDKAFRKQEGSGEVILLATHVTRNLFARLAPDNPYEGNITPLLVLPSSLHPPSHNPPLAGASLQLAPHPLVGATHQSAPRPLPKFVHVCLLQCLCEHWMT